MKVLFRLIVGVIAVVLFLLLIIEILKSPQFLYIKEFLLQNFLLGVFVFLIYRVASMLLPILPPDLMSFFAVSIFGSTLALALDIVASSTGALIAYYLGRNYGDFVLRRILGPETTQKLENLDVDDRHEIITLFIARTIYAGTFSSPACYWAGLERFKLDHFLWANLATTAAKRVPLFILGDALISYGLNIWVILGILIYSGVMLLLLRKYVHVAH